MSFKTSLILTFFKNILEIKVDGCPPPIEGGYSIYKKTITSLKNEYKQKNEPLTRLFYFTLFSYSSAVAVCAYSLISPISDKRIFST